ncbi:MAG: putative DNA-binding domain-containing protein [Pseudomonadota bacterium]|nr:putative DNA-binding domain-containing protein [Pseudomonadota bacterium]
MADLHDLHRSQRDFAAHIRDPENAAAPTDVEARRMAVYRELFYRNFERFVANAFPVIRQLTDDARWHGIVRDFFANYRPATPLFREIPKEFLDYLMAGREPDPADPPFLLELAHYEWSELALSTSDAEPDWASIDADGDLIAAVPIVSPLSWTLQYTWPVHRIGKDYQPADPPEAPTFLVVWRDLDDTVRFLEINAVTARLLELMNEAALTGEQLLARLAQELGHADPSSVMQAGGDILADLRRRDVILGAKT